MNNYVAIGQHGVIRDVWVAPFETEKVVSAKCYHCCFRQHLGCKDILCLTFERGDGKNVYFKKIGD